MQSKHIINSIYKSVLFTLFTNLPMRVFLDEGSVGRYKGSRLKMEVLDGLCLWFLILFAGQASLSSIVGRHSRKPSQFVFLCVFYLK